MGSGEKPSQFNLVGGTIALDLVNTLDFRFRESGPEELLASYDDVLRFCEQSGLMRHAEVTRFSRMANGRHKREIVLQQIRRLRESLAAVVYAAVEKKTVPALDLETLARHFKRAQNHRILAEANGRLVWRWSDEADVSLPLWLLALRSLEFLLSDQLALVRSCASETCRWLFLDSSKNHTRRWCDMKVCGNRMKARRYQARIAAAERE